GRRQQGPEGAGRAERAGPGHLDQGQDHRQEETLGGRMNDLTRGSVTRHLLALSAFMAASMLFQTLYYLADLYFVGRLGKEAIAAVGLSGNLMMVVLAITQTLGVG